MKFIESVASYVPGLIVDKLLQNLENNVQLSVPWRQKYETVCLFCDVSGFTALSEAMALNGNGAEGLAKHLNSYFGQMLRLIASDGGDVFKFAGDAMIVLWPEVNDDIETTVRRAAQCACAIQDQLDKSQLEEGVELSVKIGIGVGSLSVLHVGGVYGRTEYLAVGEPLVQAFHAEHLSTPGQVICSKEVWAFIKDYFTADFTFPDAYVRMNTQPKKIVRKTAKISILRNNMSDSDPILEKSIKAYVASAVIPKINRENPDDEQWGNELRRCTVMFANLGLKEQHLLAAAVYDEAMMQVHEVLVEVQQAVYQYEGSINKFLMDDKGSTLIACFGLPPVSHEDDPVRAVLSSILLCERLHDLGLVASVGITTGDVFCGVVGGKTRREYTVLGDSVNLSARLMQKSAEMGGGVLCDLETKQSAAGALEFNALQDIRVKGKSVAIKIFRPYNNDTSLSSVGYKGTKNVYHAIHKIQLQNVSTHRALSSLETCFLAEAFVSNNTLFGRVSDAADTTNNISLVGAKKKRSAPSLLTLWPNSFSDSSGQPMAAFRAVTPSSRPTPTAFAAPSASEGAAASGTLQPSLSFGEEEKNRALVSAAAASKKRGSVQYGAVFFNLLSPDSLAPLPSARRSSSLATVTDYSSAGHSPRARSKGTLSIVTPSGRANTITEAIFCVTIPKDLKFENIEDASGNLQEFTVDDMTTFETLLSKVSEKGLLANLIPEGTFVEDITLNVMDTRFFLPSANISLQWLPAFLGEAKQESSFAFLPQKVELILLRTQEKHFIQSRLAYAKRIILLKKILLVDHQIGSVVILEGDAGVGKSHFIANFISKVLTNTVPIYFVSGSPYAHAEPFGPYIVVVQQYLDLEISFLDKSTTRTDVLRMILAAEEDLLKDAVVLDELFGTTFGSEVEFMTQNGNFHKNAQETVLLSTGSDPLEAMSPEEIASRRLRLMLFLVKNIVAERPAIIIIDDAQYLDDESWAITFLLAIALNGEKTFEDVPIPGGSTPLPLMLLLSLRPIIHNRSVFRKKSLIYESLIKVPRVVFLKLDGLPDEDAVELIASRLGCAPTMVSDEIIQLISSKCRNNPWKVIQQVNTLKKCNPPVFSYQEYSEDSSPVTRTPRFSADTGPSAGFTNSNHVTKKVVFSPDFSFDKWPIPGAVARRCGAKIDRLSGTHTVILKIASVIGVQFKYSVLVSCFTMGSHFTKLKEELNKIVEDGFIARVSQLAQTSGDNDETYLFTSPFICDVLRGRMLKEQRDHIRQRILKHQNNVESIHRRRFMEKAYRQQGEMLSGMLELQRKPTAGFMGLGFGRKASTNDWKPFFCVIRCNELFVYRDKAQSTKSPHAPVQWMQLEGGSCDVEPEGVQHGKLFVFRLIVSAWRKDGTEYRECKSFLFSAATADDLSHWVYMLKYSIEMKQMSFGADDSGGSNSAVVSAVAVTGADTSDALKEPAEESVAEGEEVLDESADAVVTIRFLRARGLIGTEVYGASNTYIQCTVDGVTQRTSCIRASCETEEWGQTFSFPINMLTWATGRITVSLWNEDVFLSDDFMGEYSVPIRQLEVRSKVMNRRGSRCNSVKDDWVRLLSCGRASCGDAVESASRVIGELNISSLVHLGTEMASMLREFSGDLIALENKVKMSSKGSRRTSVSRTMSCTSDDATPTLLSVVDLKRWLRLAADRNPDRVTDAAPPLSNVKKTKSRRIGVLSGKGLANVTGKALTQRLHALLTLIDEDIPALRATPESGSVNKMWIRRELRQLLEMVVLEAEDEKKGEEIYRQLRQTMARTSEVDPQHINWLRYQYASGDFEAPMSPAFGVREAPWSRPCIERSTSSSSSFRISAVGFRRSLPSDEDLPVLAAVPGTPKDERKVQMKESVTWNDLNFGGMYPESLDALPEPTVWDPATPPETGYYYKDARGRMQGPHTAARMWQLVREGTLHVQVPTRHGNGGKFGEDFVPLAMFLGGMKRMVDRNLCLKWPTGTEEWAFSFLFTDPPSNEKSSTWDFDILSLRQDELLPFSMALLSRLRIPQKFDVSANIWQAFVQKVEKYMTAYDNPYHNYYHCIDVMYTTFVFIHEFAASVWIQDLDVFALLVSAIVHDLDHPGTNNAYQINASTSLAILYNDVAVLENHHCATTFELISNPHYDIFGGLDSTQKKDIRKLMIMGILATDMAVHFSLQTELNEMINSCRKRSKSNSQNDDVLLQDDVLRSKNSSNNAITLLDSTELSLNDRERGILVKGLLHAADISNPAKPFRISKAWSDLVIEEFFQQGDRELREGLPVSPNMDRNKTFQDEMSLNFLDVIVCPFYLVFAPLMPRLHHVYKHLVVNRNEWDMILRRRESEKGDVIQKWEKRKIAFDGIMNPILSYFNASNT